MSTKQDWVIMGPEPHPLRLTVTLPVPSPELGVNGYKTRRSFIRQKRLHRTAATAKLREAMGFTEWRWQRTVRMSVVWWLATHRNEPDDDGAWTRLKYYRDGAQHAGLVSDDRQIRQGTMVFLVGEPRVEMTFERAGEEER